MELWEQQQKEDKIDAAVDVHVAVKSNSTVRAKPEEKASPAKTATPGESIRAKRTSIDLRPEEKTDPTRGKGSVRATVQIGALSSQRLSHAPQPEMYRNYEGWSRFHLVFFG
jgi:hypothetical protein